MHTPAGQSVAYPTSPTTVAEVMGRLVSGTDAAFSAARATFRPDTNQ